MPRTKGGFTTRQRRNRVLKQAEGYWGKRKNCFRSAQEAVDRALAYSYRDRRNRKRDFRNLWVIRINAGARLAGLSYSRLMGGLRKAGVTVDRKMLADLAVRDAAAFNALADLAKSQVAA
ncbi:MAG: 50S ribosomal protein L20 [candidate division NC10 bacterium]|nr:50S ribosomal protein L20 [candidate division NC10 bacterium]MBI4842385.1 50S ribosomal protein L20 [candidate division NC10 bacterium]